MGLKKLVVDLLEVMRKGLTQFVRASNGLEFALVENMKRRRRNPIPLPHRSIPEPKGQDLDYVNVAYSHLVHSDWSKLEKLASSLTSFRVTHILLKTQKDYVLSLEFFNWVQVKCPSSITLDVQSITVHILTKYRKFKSAQMILRKVIELRLGMLDLPHKVFDAMVYSYRICDSSPRVFDALFKTYAHMKKFRFATDTFWLMKEYGFLPTAESCNAYLSSLISLDRSDIALSFYKEMRRSRISPNVYTLNIVIGAFCKLGNIEKAIEVFKEMEKMNISPTFVTFNTLIAGYCSQGLVITGLKLKDLMGRNGLSANVVTYNTLINGFCKEGKLHEASKLFSEMKSFNVAPNTVTYNTLISGYSQVGNCEMGGRLFEEMSVNGIKADILTYNVLILGLCKVGKTKKAAYMIKRLDKENLVPNPSTFSALIRGQCVRKNSERARQLYKSMVKCGFHPNGETLMMLMSVCIENEDYDEAVVMLREMIERSFSPNSAVLYELYNGLSHSGKEEIFMNLCKEMEAKHLMPECFLKAKGTNSGANFGDINSEDNY